MFLHQLGLAAEKRDTFTRLLVHSIEGHLKECNDERDCFN